jgi:large subunit ribosomal protein L35
MPKMKTHRGAAKRLKATGTGRLKRHKAYKSHILTKKTQKRKRKLRKATLVAKNDHKRVKRLLPYGG